MAFKLIYADLSPVSTAVITAEPAGKAFFFKGACRQGLQWKKTKKPCLCIKTADNCNDSYLSNLSGFQLLVCIAGVLLGRALY